MRISHRIVLSFVLVGAIVAIVAVIGLRAAGSIARAFHDVGEDSLLQVETVEDIRFWAAQVRSHGAELALLIERGKWTPSLRDDIRRKEAEFAKAVKSFERASFVLRSLEGRVRSQDDRDRERALTAGAGLVRGVAESVALSKSGAPITLLEARRAGLEKLSAQFDQALGSMLGRERNEIGESAGRVERTLTASRRQIGAAGFLGLLFIVPAVLYVWKNVANPLARLTSVAEALGQGDTTARAHFATRDEIGVLARTFDDLVDSLMASKEDVESIIASIPDAVVVLDVDGRIRRVNQATLRLLGYEASDLIGEPIARILPEADTTHAGALDPALRDPVIGLDVTYAAKDGTAISVSLSRAVLRRRGTVDGIVCVAQDNRDRKQMEESLRTTAEDLRRSNADLSQFAYVASHDLQEPLRMVASYVQLLQKRYRGKLDADADEFIHYAVDGANRMQRLIQDLLSYARVDTRTQPTQIVESAKVFDQAVTNLRVAIAEHQAEVTRDPLPLVRGDATQLAQLLQNLIGNALKFKGDRSPRVHVSAKVDQQQWVFTVRDNGIGIEPKYFERIFAIFQRLHSREQYPGTGIGLAICKRIVERHGGRIWVESEPGAGTAFHFTLPIATGTDDAAVAGHQKGGRAA
jgi:PAS domain S-box-containing protein